jgi:hypothetical protein
MMLASRLILRSRRQRRQVARLVARHALLRRTTIGARMLRVLAETSDVQAPSTWLSDVDEPVFEQPMSLAELETLGLEEPAVLQELPPASVADPQQIPPAANQHPARQQAETSASSAQPHLPSNAQASAPSLERRPERTSESPGDVSVTRSPLPAQSAPLPNVQPTTPATSFTAPKASRATPAQPFAMSRTEGQEDSSKPLSDSGSASERVEQIAPPDAQASSPPGGEPSVAMAELPPPDNQQAAGLANLPPRVDEQIDTQADPTPTTSADALDRKMLTPSQSAQSADESTIFPPTGTASPRDVPHPRRPRPKVQPSMSLTELPSKTEKSPASASANSTADDFAEVENQPTPHDGSRSEDEQNAEEATADTTAASPMQARRSRRASFEELGTRTTPPSPKRTADALPATDRPLTASDIFSRSSPERDTLDWGRLLFEATGVQPASPVSTPPSEQPSGSAPPGSPRRVVTSTRQPHTPEQPHAPTAQEQPGTMQPTLEQPSQLSETTRRFLRPLVGIEPESARVYRGALASRVTNSGAADAATAGDAIFLAAGNDDETTPETLGLLAHELTHVARRRSPRFVPPIVQGQVAETTGEEEIARDVEARTVRAAHSTQPGHSVSLAPAHSAQTQSSGQLSEQPPAAAHAGASWGGLPAPWEPLPTWVAAPASALAGSVPAASASPGTPPSSASTTPGNSGGESNGAAPMVQLAERDRTIESPAADASPAAAPPAAGAVPPDLDALARQVYAVLKQRLAAERRRLG